MRFFWRDVAFAVMILGWCVTPAPVGAQDSASGSGSSGASGTAGAAQPAAPAKPKKIWTNDDVAAASGSNSPATKSKNDSASASDTNPPFSRSVARLSIGRRVDSFFFVPVFGIGFSIWQPAWSRLAGMFEAHGSPLFRDKGWSFWL
jgi:hypothetical protein